MRHTEVFNSYLQHFKNACKNETENEVYKLACTYNSLWRNYANKVNRKTEWETVDPNKFYDAVKLKMVNIRAVVVNPMQLAGVDFFAIRKRKRF